MKKDKDKIDINYILVLVILLLIALITLLSIEFYKNERKVIIRYEDNKPCSDGYRLIDSQDNRIYHCENKTSNVYASFIKVEFEENKQ